MTDTAFFQTNYDKSACDIGIVHIGYGAFHRAHQAMYIDDFMQATGDLRWGIAAVNLRPSESQSFAEVADLKDGYLLKSIPPEGPAEYRSVRSHVAFLDAAENCEAAISVFEKPSVKAVSMTVTESGYAFKEDWSLDLDAPAIKSDLSGAAPQTIYGFLTAGLQRRMNTAGSPITIMCCDNIRGNGHVLKNALLSYIHASGQSDLADWVCENATFPCSMVDRITPRATALLQDEVANLFPARAVGAIHAEDFSQWVLEDCFANDMPDLSKVGVSIVPNVAPYEEAKIRILNGGHTGLAYLGALAEHNTFDQAMRDEKLRTHFFAWEKDEVLKGLDDSIPFDTAAYLDQIVQRFENQGIADQLERICMDGYSKMAIYVRPTLRACLAQGIVPKAGYDCVASWVVFVRKAYAGDSDIAYIDPFQDTLTPLVARGYEQKLASDPMIWGDLPQIYPDFVSGIVDAIERMDRTWQA
ncbi:MAG: mannitol dehydrogenase family protein [Planktomarina sp.]